MKKSLIKKEIAEILAEKWHIEKAEAEEKFEDVLEVLAEGLQFGNRVYLDDFGSLNARVKRAQDDKFVPGLGKVDIPAHVVVEFVPFEPLQRRLEKAFVDFGESA